jgi:tetratricopeptide (TPR) repeat protein
MVSPLEFLTAENEATYDSLISLIENSQHRLALIVAACDDLKLRQRLIDRYEAEAAQENIRTYRIVLGTEPSLRAGLARLELPPEESAVVTVTGAEGLLRVKLRSQDEQSDLDKFFGYLQWTREALREFRCPIILWVTFPILKDLSREAPDFWSWRKAVLRFTTQDAASPLIVNTERNPLLPEYKINQEFLPPLEELQSEIQQLESTSPASTNLATLYRTLGQVYANRIKQGIATDLEQEKQLAIEAFESSIARYQAAENLPALSGTLTDFGNFFYAHSRYEKAIDFYQQSLKIDHKIDNRSGEARSLYNLGIAYGVLGQYNQAVEFLQQSLEITHEIGDRSGEARSLKNFGIAYNALGQYNQAVEFLQQSLEITHEIGDSSGIASSWNVLGNIERNRGNWDEAERLYKQSLELSTELGDRSSVAFSWGLLGDLERRRGNWDEAGRLYKQSLEVETELGDHSSIAISIGCLGATELDRGNLDTAEELLKQSLEQVQELGMTWQIAETNFDLAMLESKRGNLAEAESHYAIAHQLFTQLGAQKELERIEREWH